MKKFHFFVFALFVFSFPFFVSGVPPENPVNFGFDPDTPNFGSLINTEYGDLKYKNSLIRYSIEYPLHGSDDWERSTTGSQRILAVPVMFSDVENKTTVEDLNKIMENLSKYYYNVSFGKLNLTYEVKPWVRLNKPRSYYGSDGGFENKSNLRVDSLNTRYYQIGFDTVKAVDSYVDFSKYDHLIIVHAGEDQADNQKCTDCLWSMTFPYVGAETNDNCITYSDGVYCDNADYAVLLSETDPAGVYAHELGHELGLPDLYDTENASVSGSYDLMDSGAWINSNLGAFSKLKLKFADSIIIYNETRNLTIYPAGENNTVVKIIRGNPNSWQYYLVELRTKEGYDSQISGEEVIVWSVDESFMDNKKSMHKPIADISVFNESGNFMDEEGGVFINITINPKNASLLISSVPKDLNITNRVLSDDPVKPKTCKNLDIYTDWPEKNPQYFAFPEHETDYFTVNDNNVTIWAKVNTNTGDNVTFEFINDTDSYKNITLTKTKNISRNTFNYWNWYNDPSHTALKLNSSMTGSWSVKLWVNSVLYYLNNFTITDKTDNKPPSIDLLTPETVIKENFTVFWNASDSGVNASGLKNYIIQYYDNDTAFFSGEMQNYTTNKNNSTFYGKKGHTYCFRAKAFDRAGNSNTSGIKCTSIATCMNLTGIMYANSDITLCRGFYDSAGIIINSSDIVLDCSNADLNGNGSGYGIYNKGFKNVTIKNCKCINYDYGIYLLNSSNKISNNEISNNKIGIHSEDSDSTINSNIVCGNTNLDFNSSAWLSSSGDNNTCSNPDGWNDTGKTGCTYRCLGELNYTIPLNFGWNLVSIPLTPKNTSIKSVLASVEGKYTKVGAWINGTGKHYIPGFAFNALNEINEKMGFWIKMNQTGTLTVEGYNPSDRKIPLQAGWNLVGYLSTNKTQPLTTALSSISGKYTKVGAWINGTGKHCIPGFPFNTLINMSEGYGYWIKMNASGVLEYN